MYLFSFKSRNQAMRFFDMVKRNGIASSIINTPSEIAIGCGLSVTAYAESVPLAKSLLMSSNFTAFAGLFYVEYSGSRLSVIKRQ